MASETRWRCPWGLVGMAVLVAVSESWFAGHPLRFCNTASLSWRLGVEAIPAEAARCEVACLGDSLVKIGVIPEVIRSGTGRRAHNFAMAQAPAPETYFVLRRLLEAGGHPSAIVVDFKPSILAGGPRLSLRHWQEVLGLREALELARDSGNAKLLPEVLLGRALPSLRSAPEIREAIRADLAGETSATHQTNRLALRNWGKNLGAHFNSPGVAPPGELDEEQYAKLRSDEWRCHRVNALYVDRLLALAASRGVAVYWVIPPLSPGLQARRERSGVDAAYLDFVRSMQARHPGLTVVDGRRSGYGAGSFADASHLNGPGAMAFSHELAAILARSGPGPGWVELPRYRDWPTDVPAEDINQSRIALEAETTRR